MPESNANLKWDVLLDDTEWNRRESLDDLLGDEPSPSIPQRRTRSARRWAAMGLSLLVVLGVGLPLWRADNSEEDRSEVGIRTTIDKEAASRPTGQPAVSGSPMARVEFDNTALPFGLEMVARIVEGSDGTRHREMHYYIDEDDNGGVLRPLHSLAFWGSEQSLETALFRIHFKQRDARAAEATAARLDSIYAQLRQDAGLPPNPEKLVVEVKPLTPNELRHLQFSDNRLVAPSPLLLKVPVGLSDEEILTKSIVNPLAAYVLAEARQQVAVRQEWRLMLRGLQLWQTYVGSESFVPSYREIVAWLYAEGQGNRSGRRTATSEDLQRFCREYQIWRDAFPTDLASPWLCMKSDWPPSLPFMAIAPTQLTELLDLGTWDDSARLTWTDEWVRTVAAATVIDYLVSTYGREQLPAFIAGFRTHDRWEDLVPALLSISAQKFETGWQAYVAAQARSGGKGE